MQDQERIEIILDELVRLRYGFELKDDEYRQARLDIAIESLKECKNLVKWYENNNEWPDEATLNELDWYEDRLDEDNEG